MTSARAPRLQGELRAPLEPPSGPAPEILAPEILAAGEAAAPAHVFDPQIFGAMTIDVEEHFHVSAFAGILDRADWPSQESRVAANAHRLLDLFAALEAKATFFCLGCVARAAPSVIRRMAEEGHEIASHGDQHFRVFEQSRAEFSEDLRRAKSSLEDASGQAVTGYRAPSFSIDARSPWAYEAMAETGHLWSSSSHPIKHDHYGDPNAPRVPHREASAGILEIPISTRLWRGAPRPCAGGGFFRLLPLGWTRSGLSAYAQETGIPPNFYLHPWEVDPGQPRIKGAPLKTVLRHRIGLGRAESRLKALLSERRWRPMREIYAPWLNPV